MCVLHDYNSGCLGTPSKLVSNIVELLIGVV